MSNTLRSEFRLVGQFLGLVIKDGHKVKSVRLNVDNREYWIKIDKSIRETIPFNLAPGTDLEIAGSQKIDPRTGMIKYKADRLKVITHGDILEKKPRSDKACVLICQKSDCWKKGGQSLCRVLEDSLQEQGLSDRVQIKLTGCLKQCKRGPNVVIMPDKTRYSQVNPLEIPSLVEKHFV
ncbi:MAG: hypothetical protein N5P05_003375 [Chroococcopsis gigantea SAG 12.99]|jgi:(2Fe-2S) ferredoxin|nr:(2Fe-2S) ferredoxin domain-containing protein [Chlorogloea purpurea SAG 13.99]MDV3001769.1 hypothetical protein [Chroococcopsis gigantea SAG 12.99]